MATVLAGGSGPTKLLYTCDGENWNPCENPDGLFSNGACMSICTNGSIWVAGGSGKNILGYSLDGIHWKALKGDSFETGTFLTIVWNGSYFLASGDDETPTPEEFFYVSLDGMEWKPRTEVGVPFDNSCNTLAHNGKLWVAGGNGTEHRLVYSLDGNAWTPSSSGNALFQLCRTVVFNGNMWVAGGVGTCSIAYSLDGMEWLPCDISHEVLAFCTSVAWSGAMWIAGGEGPNCLGYSMDGICWAPIDTPLFTTSVVCVAWTGDRWLAGGGEMERVNLATSTDGIQWSDAGIGGEGSCHAFGIKTSV